MEEISRENGIGVEVIVITGSKSDEKVIEESGMLKILSKCGVSWSYSIASAHRNPNELREYCREARDQGAKIFIGIAGKAADLPGAIAAICEFEMPVIAVPLVSEILDGLDSLMNVVRMPKGVPVLVSGIGKDGLVNSAISAAQILAINNPEIYEKLRYSLKINRITAEFDVRTSANEMDTERK